MLISTFTRYGLRALVRLALIEKEKKGNVSIKEISKIENISVRYLETIFNALRKAKILTGNRGKNGGFILNKKPEDITSYEIVQILDGEIGPVTCVFDKNYCDIKEACKTFPLWKNINEQLTKILKNTTIKKLMNN